MGQEPEGSGGERVTIRTATVRCIGTTNAKKGRTEGG